MSLFSFQKFDPWLTLSLTAAQRGTDMKTTVATLL